MPAAAEYLERHGIRDKLCALIRDIAIHQPANPHELLDAVLARVRSVPPTQAAVARGGDAANSATTATTTEDHVSHSIEMLLRTLGLERAFAAELPKGTADDPFSKFFGAEDADVDASVDRAVPAVKSLLKSIIKKHNEIQSTILKSAVG